MDELIDIINIDGSATGQAELKSIIHEKGFYHNTVHVWFYTDTGKVLLAQRAATKTICPLLWDVSVAGHVDSGEDLIQAAIRETQEEIGLSIHEDSLIKIGVFPCFQTYSNGIIDNEFHHTYVAKLTSDLSTLLPQKGEVESLKLVTIDAFKELLDKSEVNNHFIKSNSTYYHIVLDAIEGKLKGH